MECKYIDLYFLQSFDSKDFANPVLLYNYSLEKLNNFLYRFVDSYLDSLGF